MNNEIIMYIIAGILGIGGLAFAFSKRKTVLDRNKWVFAFPLLLIATFLILLQAGTLDTWGLGLSPFAVAGGGQVVIPVGNQQVAQITGCSLSDPVTVTLSAVDQYTATASSGTHRYKVNGGPAKTVSDAGTFTASPGDKLSLLWFNASASGNTYFSKVGNYEVPCSATFTPTEDNHPIWLIANGSLTSTVKDYNDVVVQGTTANVSLGAGDVKDATVKLSGTYRKGYPYGLVAVVEYNKTGLDFVKLMQGGIEFPTASLPSNYTSIFPASISAKKVYIIPSLLSNEDLIFKVNLDADDLIAPDNAGASENVTIKYYPLNYFINENTGGSFDGPSAEDESSVPTFGVNWYNTTIYIQ